MNIRERYSWLLDALEPIGATSSAVARGFDDCYKNGHQEALEQAAQCVADYLGKDVASDLIDAIRSLPCNPDNG